MAASDTKPCIAHNVRLVCRNVVGEVFQVLFARIFGSLQTLKIGLLSIGLLGLLGRYQDLRIIPNIDLDH